MYVVAGARKTCSISFSPFSMTLVTALAMLEHSRWAGRGSHFRDGPMGSPKMVRRPEPEDAAEAFARLVARGRNLAALLDPKTSVPGVTEVPLRSEIATIAKPTTSDGRNMTQGDFVLAAGWGHFGSGNSVMPGQGRAVERPYTPEERAALGDTGSTLGRVTFDIHLNDNASWRNVPATVWKYKLGGYQVLKKWLSYREHAILGRPLSPSEVEYFSHTVRRIAAILEMTSSSNFEAA